MHPRALMSVAVGGVALALATWGIYAARSVAAPGDSSSVHQAVRDGSHDFDFIYGKWRMPNHRLKTRLAGSNEWEDFITCDVGGPLPGGIGKWEQAANPAGSRVVAKWEQAFSADGGKTWETNWYNEFIHDDNCTPRS